MLLLIFFIKKVMNSNNARARMIGALTLTQISNIVGSKVS